VDDVFDMPHVPPLLKLYCLVKPATSVNAGIVSAVLLHVLFTTGVDGLAGKITALVASDAPHGASVFAEIVPHAPDKIYLDFIV